jgi:lambda repressor-like predicted transcriptional regulator
VSDPILAARLEEQRAADVLAQAERRTGRDRRLAPRLTRDRRVQPREDRPGDQSFAGVVSSRLYDGLRAKGWTLEKLALESGMSIKAVRDAVYCQSDPKLSTLITFAAVLEIPLHELMKPHAA